MDIHPLLLAGVTGVFIGFALCIPVGPINLTIINEGARRGFKWALLIGLGSTLMEITYCSIAFTGFDGGRLGSMVDVNIHVKSNIIEHVEDIHLMLEHMIVKAIKDQPYLGIDLSKFIVKQPEKILVD